jgi:dGTPase
MVTWKDTDRCKRFSASGRNDQRHAFEVDRDRVLYSSAFHRLAGVTQIVRAGEEDVFHTRQQHSFKVSQVGRRLAQNCIKKNTKLAKKLGVHAEVVEAACLAHDLGHPPFGHIGESTLDKLVQKENEPGGFEGNAQSFRIITKLGVRFSDLPGLNLTRATLAACIKYPWLRDLNHHKKKKKWSVYSTEKKEFEFAREFFDDDEQSAEAHLMDWADDIAYSVHDIEDFHRCSAIPWTRIVRDARTRNDIVRGAVEGWYNAPEDAVELLEQSYDDLLAFLLPFVEFLALPYEGKREQRQQLRTLTSQLIDRYINAASLIDAGSGIEVKQQELREVKLLKQITRDFILSNGSLIAQQRGQAKIITFLFSEIVTEMRETKFTPPSFLPVRMSELWPLADNSTSRFAADCVASLTEREATRLYARLSGSAVGSVLDPIVR